MPSSFLGLHNTEQSVRLPDGALLQADNVQVTKSGLIERRPAETKVVNASSITASYTTDDQSIMFIVDNGVMFAFDGNSVTSLMTGLNDSPIYWCEESSGLVFFIGGGVAGYIENKRNITFLNNINSTIICAAYHAGRLVLAIREEYQTFILMSRPYEYDTFNAEEEGFFIPNRVTGMESISGSLVITTLSDVFALTNEDALINLAEFGTPLGKVMIKKEGRLFIWTNEGLCAFPEFTNLTGSTVSVSAGMACANNLFEHNGSDYALILTDGGGFADNSI